MSRTKHDPLPEQLPPDWVEAREEQKLATKHNAKKQSLLNQAKGIRSMGTDEQMLAIMQKWDRIGTWLLRLAALSAFISLVFWLANLTK